MDMSEAAKKADALLGDTLEALPRGVVWTHRETLTEACRDAVNKPVDNSTVSRHLAVLTVISAERRTAFLDSVLSHWKSKGYKVTSINKSRMPAVFVKTKDGFALELTIGYKGQAHFSAASGCAEKSDVPEPTTKANGPDTTGRDVPRPYIKDDYWSLPKPLPGAGDAPGSQG
ncbi:hypothetical protein [Streptomyces iconiensis]|uniref:Uncharacterized protein n=1 Tax=Streptomyces iconiensis TaxID=1384038 RepID=A0ABT7A054_9ACTN|nr:hypothetical protein [Streptomyces iconiensis]MDJ1134424.1 hypothetical protein [Streptomyces iconiensis]